MKYKMGQRVMTRFGVGKIVGIQTNNNKGKAYLVLVKNVTMMFDEIELGEMNKRAE